MQGHVYHWRHGWIPLSHFAALQKAHGSSKGAAKFLSKSDGQHGTMSRKVETLKADMPMTRGAMSVHEAATYKMDKSLNESHVESLRQQMETAGRFVGDPLIIEGTNRGPLLTDGHHRLEAARRAGIHEVPVEHYANTPAGRLAAMKRLNEAERKKH